MNEQNYVELFRNIVGSLLTIYFSFSYILLYYLRERKDIFLAYLMVIVGDIFIMFSIWNW